jgi:apolipoprotein N-acyltransferase
MGLATGGVSFAGTLYWLVETMTTFGGLMLPLAVLAAALLVAYLALFPAAFAVLVTRFVRSFGVSGLLLAPAAWVASELGRQYVWDGFPWELLGYSQVTWLPVAQIASLAGVYGLSALLALTSTALALIAIDRGRLRWIVAAATTLLVAVCVGWGTRRLAAPIENGDPVRVAVLQGNVAQDQKWDRRLVDMISERYLSMTREALAAGATFVLWPESSTPYLFEHDIVRGGAVRRLAREGNATLLVGSDQVEPIKAQPGVKQPRQLAYNAAFLVKPDGSIGAIYRKMHLVPFGEYVPLQRLLFFVGPIVEAVSDFTPGTESVLLPVGRHMASTAICYEVIYGNMIRSSVRQGSELLTTITNDSWYGRSSAAYQHWDQAALRAIENGRYLARAANTGISGFVDPHGRVLAKSGLFEPGVLIQDVRFLHGRTLYSRIGDLVAWLLLILVLAALLASRGKPPIYNSRGPMALQLDEQLRRHEDLARRANDLRSYL